MKKVPPVISSVSSGDSLISQVTFEDSRCSPARSRGIENAKWSVHESPSRQTQSRNGFVDEICSSKPMQKPVRKQSSGKLSEYAILRAKRNASMKNAVFDSGVNVKKSSDLGYWSLHSTDSRMDPIWNLYALPKERLSSPTSAEIMTDTRWSWSGSSSRPSLESARELSPEKYPSTRSRRTSMPLMMPLRKSSVDDKLNLSQRGRRKGSGSSLVDLAPRLSIAKVLTIFPGTMPLMMPLRKSSVHEKMNLGSCSSLVDLAPHLSITKVLTIL
jgi:hypothetical protein